MPLLSIEDLRVEFTTESGSVTALCGVDLALEAGQFAALVGESGSGKSVTALAVLGLLGPNARRRARKLEFDGQDLLKASASALRELRGRQIGLVFQDAMSALNPVSRVGDQLTEVLVLHRGLSRHDAQTEAVRALGRVGIAGPEQRARQYAHELSGGMKQRVMIALALAGQPKLLIADEPTTALDVTIQAQILTLLKTLQAELGLAVLLITHDAGVVAQFAHRVHVMYAGRVVERGPTAKVWGAPGHPYTRALLAALPRPEFVRRHLPAIPGQAPVLTEPLQGCAFSPRCAEALPQCRRELPRPREIAPEHETSCWIPPRQPG
ncbi:MAG TPA: ABC transporter ATP-binding protein [Polyangiaceae bacterium]|nr:ABC transporter ATP-binding protein [Polyangiaceae bacterium]